MEARPSWTDRAASGLDQNGSVGHESSTVTRARAGIEDGTGLTIATGARIQTAEISNSSKKKQANILSC